MFGHRLPFCETINFGSDEDLAIHQLAETVMSVVGFPDEIVFDASKPDGTPRTLLNVDRMRGRGWQSETSPRNGIARPMWIFWPTWLGKAWKSC